jgi:hypothetical protein
MQTFTGFANAAFSGLAGRASQTDWTDKGADCEDSAPMMSTDASEVPVQRVDFSRPELCAQTRPLTCIINGQTIVLNQQKWAKLLVAVTEKFIKENNPNLASLDGRSLYGGKTFFQLQKTPQCDCATLSNGKMINTKYHPSTIVTIIGNLCQHCGVDLDDVVITYEPKNSVPVQLTRTLMQDVHVTLFRPVFDSAIVQQVTDILSTHFSNGYRLNSSIEMTRFRNFAVEDLGADISLSDKELKKYIETCGTYFEGKVYIVSKETKELVKKLAEDYFTNGARVIFFAEFYAKHENLLFEAHVVSEKMLIGVLHDLFPNLSFTPVYFGYTNDNITVIVKREILRVWGDDVLLTYRQLAERLLYVPIDRIKSAFGQNGDFVWNSVETFSHISRINITNEEREAIRETTALACNVHGYVSITDLPIGEIWERNYELSTAAVHNAVYRICLSDKFDMNGKIVAQKGNSVDALTIMKEYCKTVDKCTLNDLLNYEKELTGEVHRWGSMEAGNAILVRVDKDTYVADRHVYFNTDVIDKAIELFVKNDYLPLKSFTTFGVFPDCGQRWNQFLLESYCRRFSNIFRFDAPAVNSRNAGAVIRKSCTMTYIEIMADASVKSGVRLSENDVSLFLIDNGYTGKRIKVDKIIDIAKNIKGKKD